MPFMPELRRGRKRTQRQAVGCTERCAGFARLIHTRAFHRRMFRFAVSRRDTRSNVTAFFRMLRPSAAMAVAKQPSSGTPRGFDSHGRPIQRCPFNFRSPPIRVAGRPWPPSRKRV